MHKCITIKMYAEKELKAKNYENNGNKFVGTQSTF